MFPQNTYFARRLTAASTYSYVIWVQDIVNAANIQAAVDLNYTTWQESGNPLMVNSDICSHLLSLICILGRILWLICPGIFHLAIVGHIR
jgi:hypothetical protein